MAVKVAIKRVGWPKQFFNIIICNKMLQVPPGDASHKCTNLKPGINVISTVEFSAIHGMVAVKHTFGLQKCVLHLPSHTLIQTLDTDVDKDTNCSSTKFDGQHHHIHSISLH